MLEHFVGLSGGRNYSRVTFWRENWRSMKPLWQAACLRVHENNELLYSLDFIHSFTLRSFD